MPCQDTSDPRQFLLDDEDIPQSLADSVRRYAAWTGVALDETRVVGEPGVLQYDGQSIGVGGQYITNIIHDISHHVVAPEWRRQHPDWGLGPGIDEFAYYSKDGHKAPESFGDDCFDQEGMASMLGICVEAHLGLGCDTLDDHCWDQGPMSWRSDIKAFMSIIEQLAARGLVDLAHGARPTFMDKIK